MYIWDGGTFLFVVSHRFSIFANGAPLPVHDKRNSYRVSGHRRLAWDSID